MLQGRSGPRERDGLRARIGPRPIACGVLGLIGLAFVTMPSRASAQNTPPAQAAPQTAATSPTPQNAVPPEFAAWWNRLWSIQTGEFYRDGMELKLRMYYLYRITDTEAAKLRAEVEGKSEHPELEKLALYDEQIKNPRGITTDSILAVMDGEWRASLAGRGWNMSGEFKDTTWAKKVAWELRPGQLIVADPSQSSLEYRRFGQQSSDNSYRIANVLTTGLTLINLGDARPPMPVVTGSTWTLDFTYEVKDWKYRVISKGAWDTGNRCGTIAETVVRSFAPGTELPTVRLTRAAEHRYEPEIDWMVPRQVTVFAANGMPEREFQLLGIRKMTRSEFEEIIKLPRSGMVDAVRGKIDLKDIVDVRGHSTSSVVAGERAFSKGAKGSADERSYRWLGWVLAGSLAVLFIGLRLKRA
jgi:hypothetical protein